GIHEPGKLQAAAPRTHALTMPRPAFRAGVDQRIEVEDREGFAHLPAVRTTLELVELEQPRRLPPRAVDVQPRANAEQRGSKRGRDVERAPHGVPIAPPQRRRQRPREVDAGSLMGERGGTVEQDDSVLFSGAAGGAEAEFGALAERYGLDEVNYTFEGHNDARTRGLRVLTRAELRQGDVNL